MENSGFLLWWKGGENFSKTLLVHDGERIMANNVKWFAQMLKENPRSMVKLYVTREESLLIYGGVLLD